MEFIARFMQSDTAVITVGILAMVLFAIGFLILAAVGVYATFFAKAPGGALTLLSVADILFMFLFAQLATTTMELQYGPAGSVAQASVYTLGGFFCVLGYARLAWSVFRHRADAR